ncbi:hypothetical protein E3N88_43155 [Mikania micrantha]|uniref:Uncharacterized protein n=1 Tax=Mikania micrantha TaxID=192012 RepID=A0A5N6LGJ4_9ASTR|nr:hypothetical protein E3N88_43155 [Mikania micrantha]
MLWSFLYSQKHSRFMVEENKCPGHASFNRKWIERYFDLDPSSAAIGYFPAICSSKSQLGSKIVLSAAWCRNVKGSQKSQPCMVKIASRKESNVAVIKQFSSREYEHSYVMVMMSLRCKDATRTKLSKDCCKYGVENVRDEFLGKTTSICENESMNLSRSRNNRNSHLQTIYEVTYMSEVVESRELREAIYQQQSYITAVDSALVLRSVSKSLCEALCTPLFIAKHRAKFFQISWHALWVEVKYDGYLVEKYGDERSNHPKFDEVLWSRATGGKNKRKVYGLSCVNDSNAHGRQNPEVC